MIAISRASGLLKRAERPSIDLVKRPLTAAGASLGPGPSTRSLIDVVFVSNVTEDGRWQAVAVLSAGLRSLFNRVESTLLLERLRPDDVYWRAVLGYIGSGRLQAVLDEYIHHLWSTSSTGALDNNALMQLAKMAADGLFLRPSTYRAFDTDDTETSIRMLSQFALRYGGRHDELSARPRGPGTRSTARSGHWRSDHECGAGGHRLPLVVLSRCPLEHASQPRRLRAA